MSDAIFLNLKEDWKETSNLPLYRNLYDQIRTMILSGRLQSGSRLLPSRILAQKLSVSRNTVTQAFELLQADGFIISKTGSGVFVSDDIDSTVVKPDNQPQQYSAVMPDISKKAQNLCSISRDRNYKTNNKPFAPGRPALEDFPFDIWARLLSRRWRLNGPSLAMDEEPAGYRPLRQQIAQYLQNSRGVNCDADQVMIVSGAQQGLDLVSRVLWEEGDRIIIEDPGFPGVVGVIKSIGAVPFPIRVDEEGLDVEKSLRLENIKSFLVTPSRNYPEGTTMSLSRRIRLLEISRKKAAWIIEDDFDSDFRFDGRPLSSLQGLDTEGRVIYVGSFSRIIFPALRLGYIVLPKSLIPAFVAVKSYIDGHTSVIHQAALSDFFEEGYFSSHLRKMRKIYRERRCFLIEKLEENFSHYLSILPSDGGLHICVSFKKDWNDEDLVQVLNEKGVFFRALSTFYKTQPATSGFVMGYAGYSKEKMAHSLKVLEKILGNL